MPRKASYPDWVNKHVKKGQYVNKINGNYYLYEAHSERREGVDHPVRVCDGYIGRITQEDGIIPAQKRNTSKTDSAADSIPEATSSKPSVWIFGIILAVIQCSRTILLGLQKTYAENASLIYVMSVLYTLYGECSQSLYEMSVLSFVFPNLVISTPIISPEIQNGLDRGKQMVSDSIRKTYGNDWPLLKAYLSASVIIRNTRGYKATDIYNYAPDLFEKYNLKLDSHTFESLKCDGN